jgi:starch-binding outer membrane protein, SusD/RagB family
MNTVIKKIVCLGLMSTLAISCKKELLNPIPQTSITDPTAFDTPARVGNMATSLYSALKNGNFYGGRYAVFGEIRGEDYINEASNVVTGTDVWLQNPLGTSTNSVKNLWAQAYYTINLCNLFIDGMAAKGTTVVGTTLSNTYLGEARFIRALSYYSLLQFYARPYADGNGSKPGLPLRLTGIKGSGSSDLARSTVQQVYDQILLDLNFAETNLPLTLASSTRAHRNTAIALKTRVYLTMQRYPDVIIEANKIVPTTAPFKAATGVADSLEPNIATVFAGSYTGPEMLLTLPMTNTAGDNPGTQNQLAFYFYNNGAVGSAEYSLNASGILANPSWTATDARKTNFVFTAASTKKYMSKFKQNPYLDFSPVMRYSEVMLNLAEALARTNTATADVRGLALVNAVRKRSDAATTVVAVTSADLINAVLLERRIEFLGEGMRNNDILRLLQTFPAKGSAQAKAPTDQGYIWPISADELALNKLMTDN